MTSTPRIVDARRPVEHAGNLPARVAGAVAGDPLHCCDQFMVVYAAIVGAGDCAQFNASILDLEGLDQLGTMRGQPVLKVDAGERCWELAQIGGRCADKARELSEAPVCRHKRHIFARQHQRQPLGVVAVRFHPYCRALHGSGPASLGAAAHGGEELGQGQVPLVRRAREPFRGHAADPFTAAHIHLVAAGAHRERRPEYSLGSWAYLHDGRREPLSQPSTRHESSSPTLPLGAPALLIAAVLSERIDRP